MSDIIVYEGYFLAVSWIVDFLREANPSASERIAKLAEEGQFADYDEMNTLVFEAFLYAEEWFSQDDEEPGGDIGVKSTFGTADLGVDIFGNPMQPDNWYLCIRNKQISKATKTTIATTCGLRKLSQSRLVKEVY